MKNLFNRLDPKHRRWVAIGGGSLAVLTFVYVLSLMGGKPEKSTYQQKTITTILTDKDPRKAGIDSLATTAQQHERDIRLINQNLKTLMEQSTSQRELSGQLNEIQKNLNGFQEQLKAAQEKSAAVEQQNKVLAEALEKEKKNPTGKSDGKSAEDLKADAVKREKEASHFNNASTDPNKHQAAFFANAPQPAAETTKPGQGKKKDERVAIRTIESTPVEDPSSKNEHDDEVYLPAGSILSGALITGIDAPTGSNARKDPFPVLLRIKKEAVLPNRFRADVRECFLIASAFGDLSSERAYMRAETISCVRDDGGVIENGMDAYASGEDGKAGVRGRLVSKQGAILARSLMAGFMQGVSEAFSVRQVPSINVTGTGSGNGRNGVIDPVYQQAFNSQALQGAAIGGTGRALERIADFYLEMAENLYPVIEVDAAREIDFVVKKGTQLKIKKAA
ncbi:TraB/VirB10 family protein [Metapseudomonas otitidis]|uniref:TraB/VirB10 family protein n=1 Tax=Metapseudomonas otitidis TaxID=319939 RepID=UPI001F0E40B3|nr:TrbI/VirB10 family protein [Pseudomonas otitidis]